MSCTSLAFLSALCLPVCLQSELVPGAPLQDEDELMDFQCSVSPVPSPPPSLQLESTAEMQGGCQQTLAKRGSSNGTVAIAMVVGGTGQRGEALDDADFGFTRRLSQEPPAGQPRQLTTALFGSFPDEVGKGLRGELDDDITESMVIPGTPQAKRVRNVCMCVCVCVCVCCRSLRDDQQT